MGVDPAWRCQGVGESLIEGTREKARNKALKLTLEVRVDNLKVIKLYEKTGFFRVGLRKNYYEGKVDGLLMDSLVGATTNK
jgi:ribosomal-protein-alanine N-acetyltransferase